MSISGSIIGVLIFLQINYLIRNRILKAKQRLKQTLTNPPIIKPSSIKKDKGYKLITNPKFSEFFSKPLFQNLSAVEEQFDSQIIVSNEEVLDDMEQLDIILDKISEHGHDSLSPLDKDFLIYYSHKLNQ